MTSCGTHGPRLVDRIVFDDSAQITAACVAVLDRNGSTDLALAVSEYGSNQPFSGPPVSTSIFVFENKKGKFHYIWKSRPLVSVDPDLTSHGEEIQDIRLPPDTNDHTMLVDAKDSTYSLWFDGTYFEMEEKTRIPEKNIDDSEIKNSFHGHLQTFRIYSGKKHDLLFANFTDKSPDMVYIYVIKFFPKLSFRKIGAIRTGPVIGFNVVHDPESTGSFLLAGTEDHKLLIFTLPE